MKDDLLFMGVVLLLMFLFMGDPDVFDSLTYAAQKWLLK